MTTSIGFIGLGEIAEAMLLGLDLDSESGGEGASRNVWVSNRSQERSVRLSKQFENVRVADNQEVINQSDIVVLAMMKSVAVNELRGLTFSNKQRIISVMVDVSLEELQQLCSPARDISITIPLPFIAQGNCPLPVYPDTGSVAELYGKNNPILAMASESALNAHFAVTAMASVTFDQMQSASAWLSAQTGECVAAEIYLVTMLGGYITSLPADGQSQIQTALLALSTEGGLNATLKQHMRDRGVLDDLQKGLDGFKERLKLD